MTIENLVRLRNLGSLDYNTTNYKSGITGTSDCNDYIPVYALYRHEMIAITGTPVRLMQYSMPTVSRIGSIIRGYNNIILQLIIGNTYTSESVLKVAGVTHEIFIERGLLFNAQGEILLCLGIKTDYLLETGKEVFESGRANPEAFMMVTSTILDEPRYKILKKKLEEGYFSICESLGVDIVRTTRIKQWFFKNNAVTPEFKNVLEMKAHLKQVPEVLKEIV